MVISWLQVFILVLGEYYVVDVNLLYIYVLQMIINGIEGYFNGVNMVVFVSVGYMEE